MLVDFGYSPEGSYRIILIYFFLPINFIDTINNHGSLGTAATVIIAIYLWYKNRYFWSAAMIAAGVSIKIYPIFAVPFLTWSFPKFRERFIYGGYFAFWLFVYHIPVILYLPEYYEVLFLRTGLVGGVTFAPTIDAIANLIGFFSIDHYYMDRGPNWYHIAIIGTNRIKST